jgi:hypothetical protein
MMPPRAGPPLSWPWLPVLMLWDKMTHVHVHVVALVDTRGRDLKLEHDFFTQLQLTLSQKHVTPGVFM